MIRGYMAEKRRLAVEAQLPEQSFKVGRLLGVTPSLQDKLMWYLRGNESKSPDDPGSVLVRQDVAGIVNVVFKTIWIGRNSGLWINSMPGVKSIITLPSSSFSSKHEISTALFS